MRKLAWAAVWIPMVVGAGDRWWSHVVFLADDKLEGRNTGSEGYRKAAAYVAGEWERAGLRPAGTQGYFQPVKFRSRRIAEEQSGLEVGRDGKWEALRLGEDANINMRTEPPESLEAAVVFAGYGLVAPEHQHDDLAGLDLKGKVVLYISGGPSSVPGDVRAHYQSARERWKALEKAGVVGALQIDNPKGRDIPWERSTLARLQPAMSLAEAGMRDNGGPRLSVTVNPAHAERWFAGSGHTFRELLETANAGKALPRFALPWRVRTRVRFEAAEVECRNVVGIREGSDPKLKNEYVVLSAHLDHVGVGKPIGGDTIYNGAMDNAAGISSLIELAARLKESGAKLRRSVLFVALTGEEKGLQGSRYFAAQPTVPAGSLVANLNLDMFLPLFPLKILTVFGLNESELGERVRAAAEPLGIRVQADPEPERNLFIRSDQYNFILRGTPALAFKVGYEKGSREETTAKTWLRERYHAPSDDVKQPVDLGAAEGFHRVMLGVVEAVANQEGRPRWREGSFFGRFQVLGGRGGRGRRGPLLCQDLLGQVDFGAGTEEQGDALV